MVIKKPLASLMNQEGEEFSPQPGAGAGISVQNWGMNQALNDRFAQLRRFQQTQGRPGGGLNGFLSPQHTTGLPNQWDIFGQVMRGRQDAVEGAGQHFDLGGTPLGNEAAPNTRWDPEQVGVNTGHTLRDDEAGFQNALNHSARPSNGLIGDLRRRFGLN
jgi:hypothetical protein